jgi:hypothetical protein
MAGIPKFLFRPQAHGFQADGTGPCTPMQFQKELLAKPGFEWITGPGPSGYRRPRGKENPKPFATRKVLHNRTNLMKTIRGSDRFHRQSKGGIRLLTCLQAKSRGCIFPILEGPAFKFDFQNRLDAILQSHRPRADRGGQRQ